MADGSHREWVPVDLTRPNVSIGPSRYQNPASPGRFVADPAGKRAFPQTGCRLPKFRNIFIFNVLRHVTAKW